MPVEPDWFHIERDSKGVQERSPVAVLCADDGRTIMFWCPGCNEHHGVPTAGLNKWEYDGNIEAPTLKPSLFVNRGRPDQCHFWLTAGVLQYLGECHHELRNQKVPLPPLPD